MFVTSHSEISDPRFILIGSLAPATVGCACGYCPEVFLPKCNIYRAKGFPSARALGKFLRVAGIGFSRVRANQPRRGWNSLGKFTPRADRFAE